MKLLITRKLPQAGLELLSEHPEIQIDYRQGPPLTLIELEKAIKGVDAIIPVIPDKITSDVIKAAGSQLKIIATYSVGYDHIDLKSATQNHVYVSNTPGDLTESVAEHTFALMLALGRNVIVADDYVRAQEYKFWDPMIFLGPQFSKKTLGIVGFGRIGQHLAKIAYSGLDMQILYTDKNNVLEAEKAYKAKKVTLDELLQNSDVISLNCNYSKENHHLINEHNIHLMKPTSYLINTARGAIIDEQALVEALKQNIIEGAALDVFENEPQINSELLHLKNVILTPHIGSATREARIQMARMAALNVIEVLINKKPPINLVNTELAKSSISSLI